MGKPGSSIVSVASTEIRDLAPSEMTLLAADDNERDFASDYRRRQFQCGRALVRLLLQQTTGQAAASHRIDIEDGGKPVCPDGPAISIAHTGSTVVALVADSGLAGIDIERVEEERDVSQIAQRFFSVEEQDWINAGSIARFYMLWVLKEAFVKAHGRSIFGGLEKLRCTVEPPRIQAEAKEGSFEGMSLYQDSDLFLAIATTTVPIHEARFQTWRPETVELADTSRYSLLATT